MVCIVLSLKNNGKPERCIPKLLLNLGSKLFPII